METKKKTYNRKRNFMKSSFINKNKEDLSTTFHLSISSKAMFNLSADALKLYMFFILNGKRNVPTVKIFAQRMKKSERTVQRYYEELKEKGFLKIVCISPKVYKYLFDSNGNVNVQAYKEKPLKEEVNNVEVVEEIKYIEEEKEINEDTNNMYLAKALTIVEYEDFAILENVFWTMSDKLKKEIISIIEIRIKKEFDNEDVLKWFLEKVKYV